MITEFHEYGPGDVISSVDLNAVRTAVNSLERWVTEELNGTKDGVNDVFTTTFGIESGTEEVCVNGIPSPDFYTLTDANEITFESPPKTWWNLRIRYRRT